jgi:spore coat polysaccharide biosynthesis protein SpsF
MDVEGAPMLSRLVERVSYARRLDKIMIATTTLAEDDALEDLSRELDVECFRGSPDDVLGRVKAAALATGAGVVATILGDNPLVHSNLIDDTIGLFEEGSFDYTASVTTEYPSAGSDIGKFPIGIRVQVFSIDTIEKAARMAEGRRYREDATAFMFETDGLFRLGLLEASGRWDPLNAPTLHFAVNYLKNMRLLREIFRELYPRNPNFSLEEMMDLVLRRRELLSLMGG